MEDLYSDTTDSFTVGMASGPLTGVAIFSFARYDPLFSSKQTSPTSKKKTSSKDKDKEEEEEEEGKEREDNARILLERSCKVLAHEIGHMMGIAHCTYYECLMNGSGHLIEDFRQPLHLCPVDLRKLLQILQVSALARYNDLVDFYEKMGFVEERDWIRKRIHFLESQDNTVVEKKEVGN